MKQLSFFLSMLMLVGLVFFNACEKDEDPTITLVSLTADGIDLAGATTATDVPEDAVITATFSSDIDATSANDANFALSISGGGSVAYTVSVNGAVVTLTPTDGWDGGTQFSIAMSAAIKGANGAAFEGNTLTFRTSGIFIPQKEKQVLYINFDGGEVADKAGDHTVNTVATMLYQEDRWGTANSAGYFDGEGNLVEIPANADLISPSMTISFWFKTDAADYIGGDGASSPQSRFVFGLGVENGYFMELGRRSNDPANEAYPEFFMKIASDHVNIGTNAEAVPKATAWTEVNSQIGLGYEAGVSTGWSYAIDQLMEDPANRTYLANQVMNKWTHMAITFDALAQTKTIFINGSKWAAFTWISSDAEWLFSDLSLKSENNDGSAKDGIEGSLALGFAGSSTNTATGWATYDGNLAAIAKDKKFYKGGLDQFRIFSVALNDADVQMIYNNEK